MITEDDLRRFCPKAKKEYVTALLGGLDHLRAAGVLENEHRLSHFMAQFGAETGGGTIIRESLYYTTAQRLRQVWPARFRNKSNDQLRPLLRNETALGDAVYMGRMGNTEPGDGYKYRGGGFIQTTGKSAVAEYAGKLGLSPTPTMLDDCAMTLRFACLEWQESGCNEWADQNDIVKVSKAINTGSANSKVAPVGMTDRRQWFAKAWGVWGDKGKPDTEPKVATTAQTATVGTVAGGVTVGAVQGAQSLVTSSTVVPAPPQAVTDAVSNAENWRTLGETVSGLTSLAASKPLLAAAVVTAIIGFIFGPLLKPYLPKVTWGQQS